MATASPQPLLPTDPIYRRPSYSSSSAAPSRFRHRGTAEQLRHDRINVARLVVNLERSVQELAAERRLDEQGSKRRWWDSLSLLAEVEHAQGLLVNVRESSGSAGSSSPSSSSLRPALEDLEARLARIEASAKIAHDNSTRPVAPSAPSITARVRRNLLKPPPAAVAIPPAVPSPERDDVLGATSTSEDASVPVSEGTELNSPLHKRSPSNSPRSSPPVPVSPTHMRARSRSARDDLLGGDDASGAPTAVPGAGDYKPAGVRKGATTDTTPRSIDTLLQHHRETQDSLTADLALMASRLKANTLAFSHSLDEDKQVLEDAAGKLEGNLTRMQKEGGRLKTYTGENRGTTCLTLGAIAVVVIAWCFMFVVIRIT